MPRRWIFCTVEKCSRVNFLNNWRYLACSKVHINLRTWSSQCSEWTNSARSLKTTRLKLHGNLDTIKKTAEIYLPFKDIFSHSHRLNKFTSRIIGWNQQTNHHWVQIGYLQFHIKKKDLITSLDFFTLDEECDFVHFLEYGTKLKIHSEINPPLNPNNILFYIYHSLVVFSTKTYHVHFTGLWCWRRSYQSTCQEWNCWTSPRTKRFDSTC